MRASILSLVALSSGAHAGFMNRPNRECFTLYADGGIKGCVGQLGDGQARLGDETLRPSGFCMDEQGQITDSNGRGCLLTPETKQFQCDEGNTNLTSGFRFSTVGNFAYKDRQTFFGCPATDTTYNIYGAYVPGQKKCLKFLLIPGNNHCHGGPPGYSGSLPPPDYPDAHSSPAPGPSAPGSYPSGSPPNYPSGPSPSAPNYPSGPSPSAPVPPPSPPSPPCYGGQGSGPNCPSAPPPSAPSPSAPAYSPSAPPPSAPAYSPSVPPSAPAYSPGTPAPSPPSPPSCPSPCSGSPPSSSCTCAHSPSVPVPAPSGSSYPSGNGSPPPSGTKPSPYPSSGGGNGGGSGGSSCTPSLAGPYQSPHLIVPVSSNQPDVAFGTQYFGYINSTTSTIFNFDVPSSYAGQTCAIIFLLPQKSDLETADYTFSGQGNLVFRPLSAACDEGTTYNNRPAPVGSGSSVAVQPGGSYTVFQGPCDAGNRVSVEVGAANGLELEFFEDWNPSPLGCYMVTCQGVEEDERRGEDK